MTMTWLRSPVKVLLAVMAGMLAITAGAWISSHRTDASNGPATSHEVPRSATIEDEFGIRILGAYMTAANGMVEIQYQVLDAGKAGGIAADDTSPVIQAHGTTFDTPGLSGHGHTHRIPTEGQRGFVLLANTEGGLREGDPVTVKVGDLLLEGVVLE
jgi:hypothetical protein